MYQLGIWKAGKTSSGRYGINGALYQLGIWKGGKTYGHGGNRGYTLAERGLVIERGVAA